jgi:uncharacterized membrane protein YoaK (UPF0700 family)
MKKVIGIFSIVLFIVVEFQSCAAGLGNALSKSNESSGSAGFILGVFMLIAGILTLVSKRSKGILITSIVLYILGALIGFANVGHFKDLSIWAGLNLIFGALLIFHLVKNKELYGKK